MNVPSRFVFGALAVTFLVVTTACVKDDPGPSAPVSCEGYCTEIQKTCGGDSEQYRSTTECVAACKLLDLGTEADGDVNTVGCRLRRAKVAKSKEDCAAAGPFGGGVCGSRCSSFCKMLGQNCATQGTPIPFGGSEANCNEGCGSLRFDASEGESTKQEFNGGDTLNCRQFHLILSLSDQAGHCGHAAVPSATCN